MLKRRLCQLNHNLTGSTAEKQTNEETCFYSLSTCVGLIMCLETVSSFQFLTTTVLLSFFNFLTMHFELNAMHKLLCGVLKCFDDIIIFLSFFFFFFYVNKESGKKERERTGRQRETHLFIFFCSTFTLPADG